MNDNRCDIEALRALVSCDPETGVITRRSTGQVAFASTHSRGYRHGTVAGQRLLAHRVVWALTNGKWPSTIDHINGDKSDNRLVNLRSVTQQENCKNSKRPKNNTSGAVGVCWDSQHNKWRSSITVNRKTRYIGLFSDIAEAVAARERASRDHGFHENHGRCE